MSDKRSIGSDLGTGDAAQKLRDRRVTIIAVAMGTESDSNQLGQIVAEKDHVFRGTRNEDSKIPANRIIDLILKGEIEEPRN